MVPEMLPGGITTVDGLAEMLPVGPTPTTLTELSRMPFGLLARSRKVQLWPTWIQGASWEAVPGPLEAKRPSLPPPQLTPT